LKIKIRRKKGKEIKYKIEIKQSSNLFRGPQKKIKFTFTADEMNELSRDRLLRTVNYKKKLYRCKIFKRCKKIVCTSKNKQLCEKIKRKRRQKWKKEKTVTITSTPKSLFRGSFFQKQHKKNKKEITTSTTPKSFFRGSFFGLS